MATGDDRYQPALTAANLSRQPKPDLVPMLHEVQEQLRKLFEVVAKLEGRLGTIALRDDVTIAGSLTVADGITFSVSTSDARSQTLFYPSYANWHQTSTLAGPGSYVWDTETSNTGEYTRQAGDTQIVFGYTGAALVMGSPLLSGMGANANVQVSRNGTPLVAAFVSNSGGQGQGFLNGVMLVTAGDYIEIINSAGNRYGAGDFLTRLAIVRIK